MKLPYCVIQWTMLNIKIKSNRRLILFRCEAVLFGLNIS